MLSLLGLLLQAGLFVYLLLFGLWCRSLAVQAAAWQSLGGVGIWLCLLLVFRQKRLLIIEQLEATALARGRGGSIFEADAADQELMLSRRRIAWMLKWLLPIAALVTAAYCGLIGLWLLNSRIAPAADDWPALENAGVAIWFVAGAAFVSFLFSRYAMGMARYTQWQMMRAGGSWLFGTAVLNFLVAVGLTLGHYEMPGTERVSAYVIASLLIVLAAELVLNFVLEVYRPREPGTEGRPAFDSRVLGLFSEPGGVAHTIAEAINYQFGFEVSKTWFYQLVQRAFIPLMVFGILSLLALSSVVIVRPEEQAVQERFGRPLNLDQPWEPGIHFKAPWPIDSVRRFDVQEVQSFVLGVSGKKYEDFKAEDLKVVLWTSERHWESPELDFLVNPVPLPEEIRMPTTRPAAGAAAADDQSGRAVAASIIRVTMPIHWRIRDIREFGYEHVNAGKLLEDIAFRELVQHLASLRLDQLLGDEQQRLAPDMRVRLERRIREERLGVEVLFVGLQGIHPPKGAPEGEEGPGGVGGVAASFEEVLSADQSRLVKEQEALKEAGKMLSEVVGSEKLAGRFVALLDAMEWGKQDLPVPATAPAGDAKAIEARLREAEAALSAALAAPAGQRRFAAVVDLLDDVTAGRLGGPPADARGRLHTLRERVARAARAEIETLFAGADSERNVQGQAAEVVAKALTYRWQRENAERAAADTFLKQLLAFKVAPQLYQLDRQFEVLREGLAGARKYLPATTMGELPPVIEMDLKDTQAGTGPVPLPDAENR